MKFFNTIKFALISLVITLTIWELTVIVLKSPLFPSMLDVGIAFFKTLLDTSLYVHMGASIGLVFQGFVLSVFLALPTALVCYKFPNISKMTLPSHEFIRYIPVPAFVPLCLAIFGVEDLTKIVLIFIGTYFQQLFLFISDLQTPNKEIEDGAKTLGITGFKLVYKVTLPSSLPYLLDSIRITFAWAWSYLLVAEVINARRGIGFLVLQSYRVLNMHRLVALLLVIGIFGLFVDAFLRHLKKYFCPWLIYE